MSKNEKKILTQKLLLKLKNLRKPDQSRIKFYNLQPFKTQGLVYLDREITKIWFSSLSMFSNFWHNTFATSYRIHQEWMIQSMHYIYKGVSFLLLQFRLENLP